MMHHTAVECVAGQRDPIVAQNFVASSDRRRVSRAAKAQDGKVAGAAAEVADQNYLVTRDSAGVVVGRGYRFIFESNVLPSRAPNRHVEPRSRIVVVFG